MNKNAKKIYSISLTGMLSAVSFLLMFLEFPLPALIPAFIKFDISDLPAIFGAFAMGPLYGVVIELIKNVLHILIKGTSSAFIGELSNFLLGSVFVLTAGLIYKRKKTKKSAVAACVLGAFLMGVVCVPLNYFVVYPAYVVCYKLPLDAIIGMYEELLAPVAHIPTKNALLNCLVIFNFPFTFVKGLVDSGLCLVIYKPLRKALSKFEK